MTRARSRTEAIAVTGLAPSGGPLLGLLAAPSPSAAELHEGLASVPPREIAGLLERLAFHGTLGLAHLALSRLPQPGAHPWLRAALRRSHQRQSAATLARGLILAEVLEAFEREVVPVAVLGGVRAAEGIYGDRGARPCEDHDLLVCPEDLAGARAALRRLDFEETELGRHRRGGALVSVRTHPFAAPGGRAGQAVFPLHADDLLARARRGRVAGAPALLLLPEDELIIAAFDLVRRSFARLIGIADLAHLVAAYGRMLCWEAVRSRAEAARAFRLVRFALASTTLLGVSVPADFNGIPAGPLEAALMRRVLELRPVPLTGEILMALQAPTLADGARLFFASFRPAVAAPARPAEGSWTTRRRPVAVLRRAVPGREGRRSARGL